MKKSLFFYLFISVCFCSICHAQLVKQQQQDCKYLLSFAENTAEKEDWIYNLCGFNNVEIAWSDWAPYVSEKQYAKALYQLCVRYPTHEYGELYCKKSAHLKFLPALYFLAQKAKKEKNNDLYESYLKIITENEDAQKNSWLSSFFYDAYRDLAEYYYQLPDTDERREYIVPYLQIAADNGDIIASATLAILLYSSEDVQSQRMYEKYLWKAILNDCPTAEEFLGLINLYEKGNLTINALNKRTEKILFYCHAAQEIPQQEWSQEEVDACSCLKLLQRVKMQENKPFKIIFSDGQSAVLKDRENVEYSVSVGDKIAYGYVVEEIHPTAVKIKKQAVSETLIFIDPDCLEICQDVKSIKDGLKRSQVYKLTFTQKECEKIVENIENLENPLNPFRGVQQCRLQDRDRWEDQAIEKGRNKHLFLLGNYRDAKYIPAMIANAQILFAKYGPEAYLTIIQLLKQAIQMKPTDELSEQKQNYAYCLLGALMLNGPMEDNYEAVEWLEKGVGKYAVASNMMGIAYANGFGVEVNNQKAKEFFNKAMEQDNERSVVSIDALRNLNALSGKVKPDQYGPCERLLNEDSLTKDEIIEIYKQKEKK